VRFERRVVDSSARTRGSRARALHLLLTLIPVLAGAQEPPSHLSVCETDAAARAFLARVRYLLSTTDSDGRARLHSLSLAPTPAGEVTLVIEEPVCLAAASAYAANAHRATGLHPPFPVAIVRVPGRFLVQLGGVTPEQSDQWEVEIFDSLFRRLASY
jgi:hypothetical protein